MRNYFLLLAPIASAWALSTVRAEVPLVIAKGGSIELTTADVRTLVASLPEDSRHTLHQNLPALEKLLRGEIVERAVLADAQAKNFSHDAAAMKQLERVQQQALMQLWIAAHATPPADYPSDADVQKVYEALKGQVPLEYHLAQIFISVPNGADAAKTNDALRKAVDVSTKLTTTDFAQLARTLSDHAESAQKGGDLGFLPGERLEPDVFKAVGALKPGQIAGPIKVADGLHFLKLIETRPATLPPLGQVHDRIVADLRARRAQQLQQDYLNELAGKLGISINEIELAKVQSTLQ